VDYLVIDNVPILIDEVMMGKIGVISVSKNKKKAKLISRFFQSITIAPTVLTDDCYLRAFDALPDDANILNLGSGGGLFDECINKSMLNLDVILNERTGVVADAHYLPLDDNSVDGVFSNAVLEHVEKPWIVVEEIHRVLKPNGIVSVNLPFMNPIHGGFDYFRFTKMGMRSLFDRFEELSCDISSGGGSFWPWYFRDYIKMFIPGRHLKSGFSFLWEFLFYWFKWIDYLVKDNPEYHRTATSVYFVGIKK